MNLGLTKNQVNPLFKIYTIIKFNEFDYYFTLQFNLTQFYFAKIPLITLIYKDVVLMERQERQGNAFNIPNTYGVTPY